MKKELGCIFGMMLLLTVGCVAAEHQPQPLAATHATQTTLQTEIMTRDFDVSYQLFQTFGVHAVIHNVGLVNATAVHWKIALDKGLVLMGKQASGVIPVMFPDQSIIVKIPFVIGFGKTHITVTANASNANATNDTGYGKIMGF
jgi:hypothetical protein